MAEGGTGPAYTRSVVRNAGVLGLLVLLAGCAGAETSEAQRADALVGLWQTAPLTLTRSAILNADQACRAWIQDPPDGLRVVDANDLRIAVIDARGAGRIQMHYVGRAGATASCFDMPIDAFGHVKAGGGGAEIPDHEPPPLGPTEISTEGGTSTEDSTVQLGRVGESIVKVVIMRPKEEPITASLANGWYLAWWPDTVGPGAKAVGSDASGLPVAEVALP